MTLAIYVEDYLDGDNVEGILNDLGYEVSIFGPSFFMTSSDVSEIRVQIDKPECIVVTPNLLYGLRTLSLRPQAQLPAPEAKVHKEDVGVFIDRYKSASKEWADYLVEEDPI